MNKFSIFQTVRDTVPNDDIDKDNPRLEVVFTEL